MHDSKFLPRPSRRLVMLWQVPQGLLERGCILISVYFFTELTTNFPIISVAILNTQKQQRDFDDSESFIREDEMDFAEREFDDAELDARDYDYEFFNVVERDSFEDSELIGARDPEPGLFGGIIKIGTKVVKNFIRDEETGDIYVIREPVDIEELD